MTAPAHISVIIAAYHGEKYIGEQLKSLFAQTRVPDEILIGDDSDDDATFHAVELVRDQYTGELRYIRNPQRLGFKLNFVNLAREAKGDLIFFCDQDDIWLPDKIETLADRLQSDSSCQVVVCNSELVDAELNSLHRTMLSDVSNLKQKTDEINAGKGFFPLLNMVFPFSGHNMAIKRSFLPVFLQIPDFCEYHDVWLFQSSSVLGKLRYVDKVLTWYRVHDRNVSAPQPKPLHRTFLQRLREIRHSSKDVFGIAQRLHFFSDFIRQNDPDNANRTILEEYDRYFSLRADLLRMTYFRRLLTVSMHPCMLKDYFRYGTGIRSLVRDLVICPPNPAK